MRPPLAVLRVLGGGACRGQGGRCEGPPGLRGDDGPQAFYGAHFRDPEGNGFCAFRMGPA